MLKTKYYFLLTENCIINNVNANWRVAAQARSVLIQSYRSQVDTI